MIKIGKYDHQEKWQKEHIKRLILKLNKDTDKDIIQDLDTANEPKNTRIKKYYRLAMLMQDKEKEN
ncbi:MAG: hypothetical protein KBS62_00200 [Oscillospiraceae bacterium]|nr:hypothetical protein [Candidatus Ruminococcus equi]